MEDFLHLKIVPPTILLFKELSKQPAVRGVLLVCTKSPNNENDSLFVLRSSTQTQKNEEISRKSLSTNTRP